MSGYRIANEFFGGIAPILLPNALSANECTNFIEEIRKDPTCEYRSFNGKLQLDKRFSRFKPVDYSGCAGVHDSIFGIYKLLHMEKFSVNVVTSVVYEYPVGCGFLLHDDEVRPTEIKNAEKNALPVYTGHMTFVFMLNNFGDYSGGDFVFPDFGLTFLPPAGSLVVFPATRNYRHQVNPILEGLRYTLVLRTDFK